MWHQLLDATHMHIYLQEHVHMPYAKNKIGCPGEMTQQVKTLPQKPSNQSSSPTTNSTKLFSDLQTHTMIMIIDMTYYISAYKDHIYM